MAIALAMPVPLPAFAQDEEIGEEPRPIAPEEAVEAPREQPRQAPAPDPEPDPVGEPPRELEAPGRGMDELVSLDFKSADVNDALKYLASKAGLNLSISKAVSGRVNVSLTDVPVRDVFELVLRTNGLAYVRLGSVYHIMTEEEYRGLYGRRFSDLREVKTFRLQYASPEAAFNLLDAMKSDIGRLLVDEDTGTVVIMETPTQLLQMQEALNVLETGGPLRVFDLRYAKAKDVEERLKDQLELRKLGFVKADERTNQLIVKALPERMKDVEKLIASLDQKTREVLIDAKIVKVTLTNSLDTGIDWDAVFANVKFHGLDKVGDFRNAATTTAAALAKVPIRPNIGRLAIGSVSETGYELLRYLETLGETKVISTPRVLVTNNQEAKIHVGTREAYVTTTTTTGQTTSTTAEEVQFIDVGIQLSVTPQINTDGYVTMKIKPEISSVVRTLTTPSRNTIPIVDTSRAETSVMVKDGATVVIGGLGKLQKKFSNEQIPILGRIPVLGEAFRRRDKDDERQDLVLFLTPHIVTGDELVSGKADEFREGLGRGLKPYRDYEPVIEDPALPDLPARLAPPGQAALGGQTAEADASGARFRVREHLRGYAGD